MKFEWIVPVVVLIVWLVSTILKSREADEPVRPRQPGGGGDGRRPTSDIDRFLQEIDRLKRKAAEERGEAVRPKPPPAVVRPKPVTQAPRVRPVAKPVRVEPAEVLVVEPAPVRAVQSPTPVKAARPAPGGPRSASAVAALNLLRSRQSLAGAILLQEVLGPPKCKR